ncbi:uncharacterized protein LOC132047946 [Lycium ferocissimum]|uniref:uncharacterized protein LOC132047946 n=1 Tax=Lycium ferocissimum TaxID=112874 RepID=UPI002815101D|nr:uncharacterized protein LOC132047946 [Lycium ferocissimum]
MDEAESVDVSRKDLVWKYTISNPNEKYFKCKFCKQQCTGTINRLKHHLAGTRKGMKPCPKVPGDVAVECNKVLQELKDSKARRNATREEIRIAATGGSHIGGESGNSSCNDAISPKLRGPIDNFVNSQARQATLNSKWKKEERKLVCQQIGRFFFSSGIPFNVANDPYYLPMFDGVANFGPGFQPPTMHELRTWILKEEVANINRMLEEHKNSWKQYGCSIMSDSWSDGKSRCFINFLVSSPAGTFFLRSIDASDSIKTGEMLASHLNKIVDEVGEENVVQMIPIMVQILSIFEKG